MVDDLDELGKLTDVNLAGAWLNIGGHGGDVGGSPGCPFVATGLPAAFFNGVYPTGPIDDPTVVMVTGSVDEVPVSTALVGVTGTTAGIYNVATPPEHRRRGYGEALTWAAVAEGRRLGCDHSALQASPMGAPIYRRMGFVDLGTYVQLADEPTALPGSMMAGEKVDD